MSDTQQVTGERASSAGLKVDRPSFEPLPAGDYELTLGAVTIQPASKNNEGSLPYVKVQLKAEVEGKKRVIFTNFFIKDEAGKNGQVMWHNGNGLLGFAKAVGTEFDVPFTTYDTTGGTPTKCLDAHAVKSWLEGLNGMTVNARVKVRKADAEALEKGWSDQNEISYFIVP